MFEGFSQATIDYLKDLAANNNKEWFEAHRADYEKHLLLPFRELAAELGPFMLTIDPYFESNPRKCVSRIHRDIRFSRDKTPYRTNMWLAFKRVYKDWKAEPTYFFEVFPDYYRYGMGFYEIPKETLERLRELILKRDKGFEMINSIYKNQREFVLEGEKYKRVLNPELPDDLQEWHQRREIYFVCNKKADERLFSSRLAEDIAGGFKALEPAYNFFLQLRGKALASN
ncbi:MAG: DUF2461 domain-containing protein [Peptococcaceae bacterium]|jgi:uncharacterized protein (TIGR02453 family)|nr:DUF2461 domain-containing protein [Peptococcaceae bacterium]MDH7525836.1 DUF2461 domain-containing protein [Peptococcaceae bacterium]